jgi:hypothetical protein
MIQKVVEKQGNSPFDVCSVFLGYQHVSFTRIDVKKLHEHWPGAGS